MTGNATNSLGEPGNWELACLRLAYSDPILGKLIRETGKEKLVCRGDPFSGHWFVPSSDSRFPSEPRIPSGSVF